MKLHNTKRETLPKSVSSNRKKRKKKKEKNCKELKRNTNHTL